MSAEESLKQVIFLVICMFVLGLLVWLGAYMSYYYTQMAAMMAIKHVKKAFFEAVLVQESAWFDSVNFTQLSPRIKDDCSKMEDGIGKKYGQLL